MSSPLVESPVGVLAVLKGASEHMSWVAAADQVAYLAWLRPAAGLAAFADRTRQLARHLDRPSRPKIAGG